MSVDIGERVSVQMQHSELGNSGFRADWRVREKRVEVRQMRSSCTVKRRVCERILKRTILVPVIRGDGCERKVGWVVGEVMVGVLRLGSRFGGELERLK
jgi:hypothetical protein